MLSALCPLLIPFVIESETAVSYQTTKQTADALRDLEAGSRIPLRRSVSSGLIPQDSSVVGDIDPSCLSGTGDRYHLKTTVQKFTAFYSSPVGKYWLNLVISTTLQMTYSAGNSDCISFLHADTDFVSRLHVLLLLQPAGAMGQPSHRIGGIDSSMGCIAGC